MKPAYDVIIVGGGPAGASCAAFCARAGLSTLVLERATFPRDKVCGDCLNPDCWPVLERLGVDEEVRRLPHTQLRSVEFISTRGQRVAVPFPDVKPGEVAVKRSALDAILLENAVRDSAMVRQGTAVCGVEKSVDGPPGFTVAITPKDPSEVLSARFLVAADGRNSVVSRLLKMLAPEGSASPNRVGLQTHAPCPAGFGDRVQMRWFPEGYGGLAPVGGGEINISLTGPPGTLPLLKAWATGEFGLPPEQSWRTIAPLDRHPAPCVADAGVFLVGDTARVVEPFTGEGIYYALRSGELAAEAIVEAVHGKCTAVQSAANYRAAHRQMYRGRLWVNRLARATAMHPHLADWVLEAARWYPGLLAYLTRKIVR